MTRNTLPPRPRGYLRPSAETSIAMREFVARYTERVAVDHFGVAKATIGRVAAGFVVQGSVLRAVEEGLRTPPEAP